MILSQRLNLACSSKRRLKVSATAHSTLSTPPAPFESQTLHHCEFAGRFDAGDGTRPRWISVVALEIVGNDRDG